MALLSLWATQRGTSSTFHRSRGRIRTSVPSFCSQMCKKAPNCLNHADGKGAEAQHFRAVISGI